MRRREAICFGALCLLSGSSWLFDQAAPGLSQGLLRLALHDGLLALAFWLASLREPKTSTPWMRLAAAAVAIFGVPQVLFAGAGGSVSSLDEVLVFLLVPVVVVIVVAQRGAGFGVDENPLRLLGPALAGLGGAALVLAFDTPPTFAGKVWLAGMVVGAVVAGVAAVDAHAMLKGVPVLRAAAVVCAATSLSAAMFVRVGLTGSPVWDRGAALSELSRCVAIEAPVLVLTVWLLREMAPVRFSARLLVVPLVVIAEGEIVFRAPLTWVTALGLALMVGGAAGLLRADSHEML